MTSAQQKQFSDLQKSLSYITKQGSKRQVGSACWTCHVNSLGCNRLHAEMKKGVKTCSNKNLILPLAYAVFTDTGLRKKAMAELLGEDIGEWSGIQNSGRWIVLKDKEFGTKGMAVLEWYIRHKEL